MPTDALPLIVRSLRPLNGPNIWSARPVLEMEVNASGFDFDDWNAADELLRARKIEGTRVAKEPNAFPTNRAAHWLGEAVLKVQREGRSPVSYHQVSATADKVRLVVEYEEEGVGCAALEFVLRWLTSLVKGESLDLPREWETFTDLAYDVRMGNSTRPTVMAAVARGIPFYRLDTESLVQLGQGCRQKRIQRATTANTGLPFTPGTFAWVSDNSDVPSGASEKI
jgi:cyanophycin synthetase